MAKLRQKEQKQFYIQVTQVYKKLSRFIHQRKKYDFLFDHSLLKLSNLCKNWVLYSTTDHANWLFQCNKCMLHYFQTKNLSKKGNLICGGWTWEQTFFNIDLPRERNAIQKTVARNLNSMNMSRTSGKRKPENRDERLDTQGQSTMRYTLSTISCSQSREKLIAHTLNRNELERKITLLNIYWKISYTTTRFTLNMHLPNYINQKIKLFALIFLSIKLCIVLRSARF